MGSGELFKMFGPYFKVATVWFENGIRKTASSPVVTNDTSRILDLKREAIALGAISPAESSRLDG